MGIEAYTDHVSGNNKKERLEGDGLNFDPEADYLAEATEDKDGEDEKKDPTIEDNNWVDGGVGGTRRAEKTNVRDDRFREAA